MQEVWKDIKGYEGMYQVSNLGRVKSLSRLITKHYDGKEDVKYYSKETYLSLEVARGYYRVSLYKDGILKHFQLHRIIAEAFMPKISGKNVINHKDSNRLNNDLDNLEWCNHSENNKHAFAKGRNPGHRKLTVDEVKSIKKEYIHGSHEHGSREIAKKYGVCKTSILDIIRGKIWREVE